MLVIVASRDVAHRLDSSMFCVEGCYEDGYVYNEDIFFMEGIKSKDYCVVGDCIHVFYDTQVGPRDVKNVGEYWVYEECITNEDPDFDDWYYCLYDKDGQIVVSYTASQQITHQKVVDTYMHKVYVEEFAATQHYCHNESENWSHYINYEANKAEYGDSDGDVLSPNESFDDIPF